MGWTELPRWVHDAQCAGRESPPCDVEHVPPDRRSLAAFEYCHGCPVTAECAADALRTNDIGVIRGGVAIPTPARDRCATSRAARSKLADVAAGADPFDVLPRKWKQWLLNSQ